MFSLALISSSRFRAEVEESKSKFDYFPWQEQETFLCCTNKKKEFKKYFLSVKTESSEHRSPRSIMLESFSILLFLNHE